MEQSVLQKYAAASRLDARTTYTETVGSEKDLRTHQAINSSQGAGIPSILQANHDPANGAPEEVDWAHNPMPTCRKKVFSDAQPSSLETKDGFLLAKPDASDSFRRFSKARVKGVHISHQQKESKPRHRQASNGRWETSYQNTCRLADDRLESSGLQAKQKNTDMWKTNYQLMNGVNGNGSERNPVGCAPKARLNKRQGEKAIHSLRRGSVRATTGQQAKGQLALSNEMNGTSGRSLLSSINMADIARKSKQFSSIEKEGDDGDVLSALNTLTASHAGRRQPFELGTAKNTMYGGKGSRPRISRLPGFSFD